MKLRDKKGSISIFVLVMLLFMSSFLIVLYASNVNKSKTVKEQFDVISNIYSYNEGDEGAYDKAYTDLRNKNKQTMTASSETATLELTKTFDDNMSNYRIYGNSVQDGTPSPTSPVEIQSVGDKTKNLISVNNYELTGVTLDKVIFEGNLSLPATFSWNIDYTPKNSAALFGFVIDGTTKYVIANAQEYNITGTILTQIKILNWSSDVGNVTNIQLEKGTIATDYEPYGKYKIPIKISGKNLNKSNPMETVSGINNAGFNEESTNNYITSINDGVLNIKNLPAWKGVATNYISKNELENLSFEVNKNQVDSEGYQIYQVILQGYNDNNEKTSNIVLRNTEILGNTLYTISKSEFDLKSAYTNSTKFRLCLVSRGKVIADFKIKFYINSTDPYMEERYNIYLNQPLRKVGEYKDYIDFKTGKVVRNISKFVMDNTLVFNGDTEDRILIKNARNTISKTSNIGMSHIWKYEYPQKKLNTAFLYTGNGYFYWYPDVTIFGVNFKDDNKTIKDPKLQEWLATQTDEVKTVYYVLATEDDTETINLPELKSFEDYTKIEVLTDIAPSKIEVEYQGYTLE